LFGFPKLTGLTYTRTLNRIKHGKLLDKLDLMEDIVGRMAEPLVPYHIGGFDSNKRSKALQLIGL
jgi:hypothetical protein